MVDGRSAWQLTLSAAAALIRSGELTPTELVESVLARIKDVEPMTLAYVSVDEARARALAAELSAEAAAERFRGSLHGVPVAVKDVIDVQGLPTRRGCAAFAHAPAAPMDAPVVAKLRREGVVILGKTVTHELACGLYSPPTRNPCRPDRCCGGSSGGSAAAVASGEATAALGSDTGGSTRIPAAFCGVVGFKPTYGTQDLGGIAPLSTSLDHLGLLARSASDVGVLAEALGWCARSSSSPGVPARADEDLSSVTLVVVRELFERYEAPVGDAFHKAVEAMRDAGAAVRCASVPSLRLAGAAASAIFTAEGSAAYGKLLRSRPEEVGSDVRLLLQSGALLPYSLYVRGLELRERIRQDLAEVVGTTPGTFLCSPTVPMPAYAPSAKTWDLFGVPIAEAVTANVVPFNLAGMPAVSLPMGLDPDGLPLGLQFAGLLHCDREVISLASRFERMADWVERPLPDPRAHLSHPVGVDRLAGHIPVAHK